MPTRGRSTSCFTRPNLPPARRPWSNKHSSLMRSFLAKAIGERPGGGDPGQRRGGPAARSGARAGRGARRPAREEAEKAAGRRRRFRRLPAARRRGRGGAVHVLDDDAVARAAHFIAGRVARGDIVRGYHEVAPLAGGAFADPGPARLQFRGQEHALTEGIFTLGRDRRVRPGLRDRAVSHRIVASLRDRPRPPGLHAARPQPARHAGQRPAGVATGRPPLRRLDPPGPQRSGVALPGADRHRPAGVTPAVSELTFRES